MTDVEILRWALAGVGAFLLLLLYLFGRSDKNTYSRNESDYRATQNEGEAKNESGEPYLSIDSLNLDLNEKEIRALANQVSENKNTGKVFQELDAFYDKVVADQEKMRDEVTPMPDVPTFTAYSDPDVKAKTPVKNNPESTDSAEVDSHGAAHADEIIIPAWLKVDTKPEQQNLKDNRKLDTVALFKADKTERLATCEKSTAAEIPAEIAGIVPLRSVVQTPSDLNHEKRTKGNPYLDGVKARKTNEDKPVNDRVVNLADARRTQRSEESPNKVSEVLASDVSLAANKQQESPTRAENQNIRHNQRGNFYQSNVGQISGGKSTATVVALDNHFMDKQVALDTHGNNTGAQKKEYSDIKNETTKSELPVSVEPEVETADSLLATVETDASSNTLPKRRAKKPDENLVKFDISFYVAAHKGESFAVADVVKVAKASGMEFGTDGSLYLVQHSGSTKQYVFSVRALNNECVFSENATSQTQQMRTLVFQLCPEQNILSRIYVLDSMIRIARSVAQALGGELYDIGNCKITDLMLTHLRRYVQEYDLKHSH